jgi:hypothetical protein
MLVQQVQQVLQVQLETQVQQELRELRAQQVMVEVEVWLIHGG